MEEIPFPQSFTRWPTADRGACGLWVRDWGLTTRDPYILQEHTELYRIHKFRVNWANIVQDTAIQKLKNLLTNVWIAEHLSGSPYISKQILEFLNGSILFIIGPINMKLGHSLSYYMGLMF